MNTFTKYTISETSNVKDALIALNNLSSDVLNLFVISKNNQVIGSISDGDIRRRLIDGISIEDNVKLVMNADFKFLTENNYSLSMLREWKDSGCKLVPILNENKKIVRFINFKNTKSLLPIDAVLMAGGKGERLRPLTEKTPKPLLKVGNKCIIDYNIDNIISYGIDNVFVTVNYLHEQIEKHFSIPRNDVQVRCIMEPTFLGTIASIKCVKEFKHDNILVMNSDLFTNIDIESFFLHFQQHNADMSVAVVPYSISVPYGIFNLNGRNITGMIEKPTYHYYANGGIYLIKKKVIDLIPNNEFFNATDLLELLVSRSMNVIRYPLTGYWIDIGKPDEYIKAQEIAKHLDK